MKVFSANTLLCGLFFGLSSFPNVARAELNKPKAPNYSTAEKACTESESWSFGSDISKADQDEVKKTLRGKIQSIESFSEALDLRKSSESIESKYLSEYWISRTLYDARLTLLAKSGFSSLVSHTWSPESAGIQFAALECLLQIQELHPTPLLSESLFSKVSEIEKYASNPKQNKIYWEFLIRILKENIRNSHFPKNELIEIVERLKNSGAYEAFALVLLSSKESQFDLVIDEGNRFLKWSAMPQSLKKFVNTVHLLVGRAYYSMQQYELASSELKQPGQNMDRDYDLELAWSYLMGERRGEAIGTAINLQAGTLRHRFLPEAPMIIAIALNELCQYFEAIQAIHFLRTNYDKSFHWLKNWQQKNSEKEFSNLYKLALEFHHKREGQIPDKIISEWMHSPLLISNQAEIASLSNEIYTARHLLPSPSETRKRRPLKTNQALLKKIEQAAPDWRSMMDQFQKQALQLKTKLLAEIENDLRERNHSMIEQLEEVTENIHIIEGEIYAGARQEGIGEGTHPTLRPTSRHNTRLENSQNSDELNLFRSNGFDNCSNSDKYAILKRKSL